MDDSKLERFANELKSANLFDCNHKTRGTLILYDSSQKISMLRDFYRHEYPEGWHEASITVFLSTSDVKNILTELKEKSRAKINYKGAKYASSSSHDKYHPKTDYKNEELEMGIVKGEVTLDNVKLAQSFEVIEPLLKHSWNYNHVNGNNDKLAEQLILEYMR